MPAFQRSPHSLPQPLSRPAGKRGGPTATFDFVASASLLLAEHPKAHLCEKYFARQLSKTVAGGALAEAKQPNVAVNSTFHPAGVESVPEG